MLRSRRCHRTGAPCYKLVPQTLHRSLKEGAKELERKRERPFWCHTRWPAPYGRYRSSRWCPDISPECSCRRTPPAAMERPRPPPRTCAPDEPNPIQRRASRMRSSRSAWRLLVEPSLSSVPPSPELRLLLKDEEEPEEKEKCGTTLAWSAHLWAGAQVNGPRPIHSAQDLPRAVQEHYQTCFKPISAPTSPSLPSPCLDSWALPRERLKQKLQKHCGLLCHFQQYLG